jgi:hypothetical protein
VAAPSALEKIRNALEAVGSRNISGDDWRCPGHEDKRASLTVKAGDEPGRVVVACGAGCTTAQILKPLGLTVPDLFDKPAAKAKPERTPYVYRDKKGQPLFRVIRVASPDGSKTFTQQGADDHGGWRRGRGAMAGVSPVLFRLPQVRKAAKRGQVVHVAEGEKDVLNLERAGVVATTKPGGAKSAWSNEFTKAMRGAGEVVVWTDRDRVGYEAAHATVTAASRRAVQRLGQGPVAVPHPLSEGAARVLLEPEPWRAEAACRYTDEPDLWFSVHAEDRRAARLVCFTCAVKQACREYAVATKQRAGIWGGRSTG